MGTVGVVGFTSGGVAAGTTASWFMSTYSGFVGATSICAMAQSIGAAGLGYGAWAFVASTGAAVGGYLTKAVVG